VRAEVLVYDPSYAAADEKSTHFQLKEVTFQSLDGLEGLSGKYFEFVSGGALYIKDIAGSQVQSDKFEGGGKPRLRYHVKDGVVIARDYNTLLLLSAYYQFEQVALGLPDVTGFKTQDFFKAMGRFKIMFEPKIQIETDGSSLDANIKLNAAFVPGQRQFILFQRSNLEKVPLAANLQVIAHEFGHALFEKTFFENKFERCDEDETSSNRFFKGRFTSEYAITGINEGFADVISWGMTGSTDILRSSLDIGDAADQRDFASTAFRYTDLALNDEQICAGRFYCVGTLFAKSVRQAALAGGVDTKNTASRRAVTREVVSSVAKIQSELRKFNDQILPPPSRSVQQCETGSTLDYSYDGKMIGAFLAAFVKNVPVEKRGFYCTAFANNFSIEGFPTAARQDCP
jgi:hypothetical protein